MQMLMHHLVIGFATMEDPRATPGYVNLHEMYVRRKPNSPIIKILLTDYGLASNKRWTLLTLTSLPYVMRLYSD